MIALKMRKHTFAMEVKISAKKKSENDIACFHAKNPHQKKKKKMIIFKHSSKKLLKAPVNKW